MLDSYYFNEETNKIELTVIDDETGVEEIITGPGVNEVFILRSVFNKYNIESISDLVAILDDKKPQKYSGAKYKKQKSNH